MSAWSLGASRPRVLMGVPDGSEFVGRVVRWMPSDVVVLFAAAINWVTPEPQPPSFRLLVGFFLVTPVVVLLGAFATRKMQRFDVIKAVLAMLAFAIWSLSVPRSGWQTFAMIKSNPGLVTTISAVGGVIFALLASGIERRFSTDEE